MLRNLDTALVRTFATVAATGSVTAAADSLGRSQGAISQQIHRLEESLRCRLFLRDKSGMQLTAEGRKFLPLAIAFLKQSDDIFREMADTPIEGSVRLGMPYDLVQSFLPTVLKRFRDNFPRVGVNLVCGASPDLLKSVRDGEIDIAIVEEPAGGSTGDVLWLERLVWIGAEYGLAFRERPLPLSIVDQTCVFRPAIVAALDDAGINWHCVFENGNIDATMAAVRADLAVSASLSSLVRRDMSILVEGAGLPALPSYAVTLHAAPVYRSAAIAELASFLRQETIRETNLSEMITVGR